MEPVTTTSTEQATVECPASARSSLDAARSLEVTLNLSTEESGYESDLTRKSGGSDKSSDTSVSNSPVSNR